VGQIQGVVGVVTVEWVIGRGEGRDGRPGAPSPAAHPLDGGLAGPEEAVSAEREHVLHRHRHRTGLLQPGHLIAEALGVAALPPERRVHHDSRRTQLLCGPHRAVELADRVGTPDPLGDEQARRVHRQHWHPIAAGHPGDRGDVLTGSLRPDHQLHAVVAEFGGALKGRLGAQRVHRRGREADLDRRTHGAPSSRGSAGLQQGQGAEGHQRADRDRDQGAGDVLGLADQPHRDHQAQNHQDRKYQCHNGVPAP
jgi:hypothetical protein